MRMSLVGLLVAPLTVYRSSVCWMYRWIDTAGEPLLHE